MLISQGLNEVFLNKKKLETSFIGAKQYRKNGLSSSALGPSVFPFAEKNTPGGRADWAKKIPICCRSGKILLSSHKMLSSRAYVSVNINYKNEKTNEHSN